MVRVSSDHSIIQFNLTNEKQINISFFCMHQTLKTGVYFPIFCLKWKYNKQGNQNKILNLISSFRYCYTISHGTFLLCGHALHMFNVQSGNYFFNKAWGKKKSLVA